MKRRYAIASLAVMAANFKIAKAQTQVIHNGTQVVSTDDVVIQQSAGGQQYVWNDTTQAWQAISNDAQVVSTGTVTIGQSAAGTQAVYPSIYVSENEGSCDPGDIVNSHQPGCIEVCSLDCQWVQFCCDSGCKTGKCHKANAKWKQQIGG